MGECSDSSPCPTNSRRRRVLGMATHARLIRDCPSSGYARSMCLRADRDELPLGRVRGTRVQVLDDRHVRQGDEVVVALVEVVGQAAEVALAGRVMSPTIR